MGALVNGATQLLISPILQIYALLHRAGFLEIQKKSDRLAHQIPADNRRLPNQANGDLAGSLQRG